MTTTVHHESLAGVPALLAAAGPPAEAARRGTVLVLHGLGGHKGIQEPELHVLARAGLLAVGLDAVGHGDRHRPDLQARFDAGGEAAAQAFREVVGGTAARDEVVPPGPVHRLHAALVPRYAAAPGRLRHLEWSESQHTMRQEDWDATWREAAAWFGRYLGTDQPGAPEPLDSAPRAALPSAP